MSADSFRALTARLRKPGEPAAPARPSPAVLLNDLAERMAKPKPPVAAVPDLFVAPAAAEPPSPAPASVAPEDTARGILAAIEAFAPSLPAIPPSDTARGIIDAINGALPVEPAPQDAGEQGELEQIRAAIFAPLKPFSPPAPEPAAAGETFDVFWTPAPPPEATAAETLLAEDLPEPIAGETLPAAEAEALDAGPAGLSALASEPEPVVAPEAVEEPVAAIEAVQDVPAGQDAFLPEAIAGEPDLTEAPLASAEPPGTEFAFDEPEAADAEAAVPTPAEALAPAVEELPIAAAHDETAEEAVPPDVDEAVADAAPQAVAVLEQPKNETPDFAPVPLPDEEQKTAQQSALAGKVVDAMLKTISTAIYAKPSATERAAFLREMAELMAEAAGFPPEEMLLPAPSPAPVAQVAEPAFTEVATPADAAGEQPITTVLADRIGVASPILRRTATEQPDPFALAQHTPRALVEKAPEETFEADEESGELALTLLDMMSGGTGSLPHERTLAADTLLRILPRIPVKQLLSVVERVAIMEAPPPLLVAKLIRDTRPEIVGPLLERCSQISDQDLMNAAASSDTAKLRMIARRRVLSTVLGDHLIATGDPAVLLTLIRNPGAAFSHEAFYRLAAVASEHHALLAPLATRNDLPPPVAFELFWHVPQELRRFIFSRFLTDSENLNRILRITLATHGNPNGETGPAEGRFPPREAVEQAARLAASSKLDEAAKAFAEMAGISRDTVLRILADREGEPFTVLMKMLGCARAKFEELSDLLRNSDPPLLRADRKADDLQAIFDGLSFNKARILITYWDWFVRKAGPYAEAA